MDALSQAPLTMCTMKAAAAAGTTTTISTTGTTLFCIKGKAYSKAVLANQAFPALDHTTGAAFVAVADDDGCILVLGFDKDGTLGVAQGPSVDLDSGGNFISAPQFPAIKDTLCPFAYVVIKNTSGATWTPGTDNWTVANLSDVFVDVMTLPDRPQVS